MPNYIEYQKSVAAEFKAYENRVRNIIDDHHWGEEGRYKEIILMNYLKRILPNHASVGTGFVKSKNEITHQIDIIIYDNTFPAIFTEGDFVIVIPESVIGIIEVKSRISTANNLVKYIKKANEDARIICGEKSKPIFNGIFAYQRSEGVNFEKIKRSIEETDSVDLFQEERYTFSRFNRLFNCVNHIVCSSDTFLKLWNSEYDENNGSNAYYSLYMMPEDLAIAYFISNLQEFVLRYSNGNYVEELPESLQDFLYPLPEGKEYFRKAEIYII